MSNSVDILAFSPHPDDVELGCGGSLILSVQQGSQVIIADMTEGEMSSQERRTKEKQRASELLGVTERISLGLPDSKIGADVAHRLPLIRAIRRYRPRIVLAPYYNDRHPDHTQAGQLIKDACFLAGVRKIDEGTPYRPRYLYHYMLHTPFVPTFIIARGQELTKK